MKTFRVHLKGSSQPVYLQGDKAAYTKDFLQIKAGATLVAEFVKSETQGYSLETAGTGKRKSVERIA